MKPRPIVLKALVVTLLGGVLGLVTLARDVYIGRLYGFSPEIKNFASVMLLSLIVINSAAGALASSYTPFLYQRVIGAKGMLVQWPLWRVFRDSAMIVLAVFVGLVALQAMFGGMLPKPDVPFTGSKFGDDFALGVLILLALYSRSVNAMLLAEERYVTSAFSQCIVPLASIIYLACFGDLASYVALVYALAFGYFMQAIFCCVLVLRHMVSVRLKASAIANDVTSREMMGRFWAMFAGAMVLALLEYIEVVFASMRSAEVVAQVNYASRITALMLGFVMAGTGNVLTLKFIDIGQVANFNGAALRTPLIRLLFVSTFIGLAVFVLTLLTADSLVRFAYAGSHLNLEEMDVLAKFIVYYALAVPPALVGFSAGRVLVARARQSRLLFGAIATVLTSILFNVIFMLTGLPAITIVFASVCGYGCSAALLVYLALNELKDHAKL